MMNGLNKLSSNSLAHLRKFLVGPIIKIHTLGLEFDGETIRNQETWATAYLQEFAIMAHFYDGEYEDIAEGSNDLYYKSSQTYSAQSGTFENSNGTYTSGSDATSGSYESGASGQQPAYYTQPYGSSNAYGGKPDPPDPSKGGPCTCGRGCAANSGCRDGGTNRRYTSASNDKCICGYQCAQNSGCRAREVEPSSHRQGDNKSSSGKKKKKGKH